MESVAVVGGSAAGLFTAYLLARGGRDVQVFERSANLDAKARTLIVTSRMADVLGGLGDKAIVNRIQRFEMFADGRVATVTLQRPDLVIERSTLIRELADHAQAAGVRLEFGRELVEVEPNGHGVGFTLRTAHDGGTARRSAPTLVARAAGWPEHPTVPLLQAVVRLPADQRPDTTRVWFEPTETPYFYWLVPESPLHGVLGLIGEGGGATRRALEGFLKRHRLEPIDFQAARIPIYRRWVQHHRRVGHGDVYLVGDAAAQVKPTTVGGIVTGFRGARGVAEAILDGGASRELRALRRELDRHLLIRRAMHSFTRSDYTRLFEFLNRPTRRLLGAHTRDEVSRILWQLCLFQPRFLLLGSRALLARRFHRRP
jgi:flavin-dependent dehydrogenase